MAVQTVGDMKKTLEAYDSKAWAKSKTIEGARAFEFQDVEEQGEKNKTFGEFLLGALNNVNNLQKEANHAIEKLVSGESKNIHETMLAVEKAEIAFKSMNQIRLKVIDAYREIMRMQV